MTTLKRTLLLQIIASLDSCPFYFTKIMALVSMYYKYRKEHLSTLYFLYYFERNIVSVKVCSSVVPVPNFKNNSSVGGIFSCFMLTLLLEIIEIQSIYTPVGNFIIIVII